MTPQLQQAIKMLQLSSLELEQEIQNVLETNPLLERQEDSESNLSNETEREPDTAEHSSESSLSETIPEELSTDSQWDDTYDTEWKTSNTEGESASDYMGMMAYSPSHLNRFWKRLKPNSPLNLMRLKPF